MFLYRLTFVPQMYTIVYYLSFKKSRNMKNRWLFFFLIIFLCLLTGAWSEEGFKQIFNGKDLDGWDGDPALWSVENGCLVGQTSKDNKIKANTFCIWRKGVLKDFELKLKFKISAVGNSGIQYRAFELKNKKWAVGGYQADFHSGTKYNGILYEERGRNILANRWEKVSVTAKGKKNVTGQLEKQEKIEGLVTQDWNEYRIVAKGDHLMHFINGVQTIDIIDQHPKKSKKEGLLALQIHKGPPMKVSFKDIELKDLSESTKVVQKKE